jgi:hypothetical protein
MNTARRFLEVGAGTQTAALAFGGGPTLQQQQNLIMEHSWTSVNSLNTARGFLAGFWYTNSSFSFWWSSSTNY